jgi:Heterokaryon incompatibility protein Het-C
MFDKSQRIFCSVCKYRFRFHAVVQPLTAHSGRFHPDFHNENLKIQRDMMKYMHSWVNGLGSEKQSVLDRLTKGAVRNHKNTRSASGSGTAHAAGGYGQNAGHQVHTGVQQYVHSIPGVAQVQSLSGMVSGISALGLGSRVEVYQDAHTNSADTGHHRHQHDQHHRGQGSHGVDQPDAFAGVYASSYGGSSADSSIPGFALPREPSPHRGGGPPSVPYLVRQDHGASSYAPPFVPPPFSSMPHERTSHGGYAPAYVSPPPGPFGISPSVMPGFAVPGEAYRMVEEDRYVPGGRDGRRGVPPAFEGEVQYGFAAVLPQPHGHRHGGHEHEEHRHEEHRHGEHKHGEHKHGEHKHGEHKHGEHKHGEHKHGEHKHGEHKHGEHKHGEHRHGGW